MSSEPKLPSEVEFASFLVYNPRNSGFSDDIARQSQVVAEAVKRETAQWAETHKLAVRLRDEIGAEIRERFLGDSTTLVPMPGHAPMRKPEVSHWPGRELCEQFVAAGLGSQWRSLLERVTVVPKSAYATREERETLTVEVHYRSFRVSSLVAETSLTLVDDVITRGTTMLAGIARLQAAFPNATVRGFALIRTMTSEPIVAVKSPCIGTVSRVPWGTKRRP